MNADGIYNHRPWMQNVPMNMPAKPNTYEQYMVADALAPVTGGLTHDQIADRTSAIVPDRFPPRFGYREEVLGIGDVARLDDLYQRVDFSQKQSGYSGSSYPSLAQY